MNQIQKEKTLPVQTILVDRVNETKLVIHGTIAGKKTAAPGAA